jgi:hypothetical protein
MRPGLLGLLALVLATLLQAGLVAPARRQLEALERRQEALREARRLAAEQPVGGGERLARERLARALAARGADPVISLRAALVRLLDGRSLRDVKLQVREQHGTTEFQLSGVGPYTAVVALAGELAGLSQAVVLESVVVRPRDGEVALDLDGRLARGLR